MISNITIKNIKGYGDPAVSIDVELKTNKVNILYAPNGSGKSSLATAFASLLPRSLKVEKENMFHKDDTLEAELHITLDNNVLVANKLRNEISPRLSIHVINAGLTTGTTQHNMGKFTSVSGYLDISDVELISNIPPEVRPVYKITDIRRAFGVNGKILPNMAVFQNRSFWRDVENNGKLLTSFYQAKGRKQLVDEVVAHIASLKGREDILIGQIDEDWFESLEKNDVYCCIKSAFSKYADDNTSLANFILIFQILFFWDKNKEALRKANKRTEYENYRKHVDWNLSLLDLTWKQIHTEEMDGKLIVHFPQADEISNGQRDILTFVSEMLRFQTSIKDGKEHLLIIDEVFDYLDDANVIAAQCFLSNFLNKYTNKLYLCILTHLNPYTFKNYIFTDKKINHVYLFNTQPAASPEMKAFVSFRQGLDREDAVQSALYDKLSHDLFHYNPVIVDYCADINSLKQNQHLKPTWGRTAVLHGFLIEEINKYLGGDVVYDPYAVALAVRLRVEKIMYEKLPSQILKEGMIAENMTKNKMKYCADNGCEMPEVYNIVNAIHNEADHLSYDAINDRYIEKPMVYKLQNHSIQAIIAHLFDWRGNPLTTEVID